MQQRQQDQVDYDLDAALDGPIVSNFMSEDQDHPRELTFHKRELSYTTFMAFIMSCCIAHYLLVTQGFLGAQGLAKLDDFAARVQDFFNKYSIHIPEDVNLR